MLRNNPLDIDHTLLVFAPDTLSANLAPLTLLKMATDTPKEDPELIPESELDETSILSSLARLQLMHASVLLHSTLPNVDAF